MPRTAVAPAKSNLPVDINAIMAAQIAEIQERVSQPGGSKITVTQSKTFKLPSGMETPGPIDMVIVAFAYFNAYYETEYDRNTITPPVCFALNPSDKGMIPSSNSPEQQAGSCSACPKNEFGSKGRGKACSNYVLLAVLPADFMEDPTQPLMLLKASATAIKPFNGYITALAETHKKAQWAVTTTVGFDPKSDYPTLRFGNPQDLTDEEKITIFNRVEEAQRMLAVEPDVSVAAPPPATRKQPAARARR